MAVKKFQVAVHGASGTTIYYYEEDDRGRNWLVGMARHAGPPLPETDYLPDGRFKGQPPPDFTTLPIGVPADKSLSQEEQERRHRERDINK